MQTDLIIKGLKRWFAEHPEHTQASVGVQAGKSNSTVRKILSGGSKNPTLSTLTAIANVIGLSLDEIAQLGTSEVDHSSTGATTPDLPPRFEQDVVPWRPRLQGSSIDIIAQVMSSRCKSPQIWRARRSFPLAGILAGDLVVIDSAGAPQPGDLVIATYVDPALTESRTLIRVWADSFLMPCDADDRMPIRIDARGYTRIMGVVAGVSRLKGEQSMT